MWQIEEYTSRIRRGEMLLDPPYQRGSCWSNQQRIYLMRSWLQGVPIPAVVLNERIGPTWEKIDPQMYANYAVVDGKQRLETALVWQNNQLAIPSSWVPAGWVHTTENTDDGPYLRASGLYNPRQVGRLMDLPFVRSQVPTIAAEAYLYRLVNGAGIPQPTADLARATTISTTNL